MERHRTPPQMNVCALHAATARMHAAKNQCNMCVCAAALESERSLMRKPPYVWRCIIYAHCILAAVTGDRAGSRARGSTHSRRRHSAIKLPLRRGNGLVWRRNPLLRLIMSLFRSACSIRTPMPRNY